MGENLPFRLIGRGVYNIAEAARLTGISARTLHRWAQGYRYMYRARACYSPPILGTGLDQRYKEPILEFRDIIEARFLSAFRKWGVSWHVIRRVAARANDVLKQTHPFATRLFRTDGRTILLELMSKDAKDHRLVDLLHDQYEWERLVHAHLVDERVEFAEEKDPLRWWPLGVERRVVVDPARAFGAPVINEQGVQTYLLAKAMGIEDDADFVAHWYDVPLEAVTDAVAFENGLRAAA